jgi:hypothetical protein
VGHDQCRNCLAVGYEREFPSDKVYRRDDRGVVGVESLGPQCLAFVVIHTSVGGAACRLGSAWLFNCVPPRGGVAGLLTPLGV